MTETFENFMRAYYQLYLSYCISRGPNPMDADEIVNEAFFRLFRKWEERYSFDLQQNKKWMYCTIENVIKEYKRKNRKHASEDIELYAESIPEERYSPLTDAEEKIAYQELVTEIEAGLNEGDKTLFHLAYVEEKSYSEICDTVNVNDQALRVRIFRLRKRIEKILK